MKSHLGGMVRTLVQETTGFRIGLPADVIGAFPELATVSWRRGGLPLRIGGWFLGQKSVAAITLGTTVFLAAAERPSLQLLLHELGHVRQFRRDKTFPIRYLWESIRMGYARNRFETEADQFAEEVLWSSTQRRPL
ncbi:MAG: DUF4157 domain-containing protein [Gemmatimonadaceae bacterium]